MSTTSSDIQIYAAPAPRSLGGASRWSRAGRAVARTLVIAGALVATLALGGAAYEQIADARDATAYPPAGRLVDVGGYRLHLDCHGEGSPTVVLDAGLGQSSLDWVLVQPELARTMRVCSFDRAGMGWSEPGPEPRSPARLADELHSLLANAGVPGPYVLVGHSLAGKNARMFAAAHPADVAGMVLVDARSELVDRDADMTAFAAMLDAQALAYSLARRLGVARLFGPALVDLPLVPPTIATRMALAATSPSAIAETTAEGLARAVDDDALAAARLGSLRLIVIAAGDSLENLPGWPEAQQQMATLSTNGELVVAQDSGHAIHLDQPAIVIDAITDLVDAIRAGD